MRRALIHQRQRERGCSTLFKNPLFFHVNSYWGSSKNFHVRTIFDRDWAQKTSLTKLVLKCSVLFCVNSYWGSSKIFHVRTIFDRDRAQKTSLTKLVLKRSVLKQSLPNFQFKLLGRSQYESYIEAAQNFFMYVPFSIGVGRKKIPSLNWFLNAQFWSNLYQILSLSF